MKTMQRLLISGLLFAALAVGLAGCGGGFNDSGHHTSTTNPTAPTSVVIQGTVKSSTGTALSGYTVTYDKNTVSDPSATLTVTTNSQGAFTLTIPDSDITGTDSLYVYDTLGGLAAIQPIALTAGESSVPVSIVISGPPAQPPLARRS